MRGGRFFSPSQPEKAACFADLPPQQMPGVNVRQCTLPDAIALLERARSRAVWNHSQLDTYLDAAQVFIDAARRTDRNPAA